MYTGDNIKGEIKTELLALRKRILKLEREQVENNRIVGELRSLSKQFAMIVENSPDLITLHQQDDLKILFANAASESLLGYSERELKNLQPYDLIHPDDINLFMKIYRKSPEDSAGRERLRFRKKDGDYICLESAWKVNTDDNGNRLVTIVSRDINEYGNYRDNLQQDPLGFREGEHEMQALKKRLQEYEDVIGSSTKLTENEEWLDSALKGGCCCLWGWNMQNGIIYINDSWANILEYEWEEHERPLNEWGGLIHPEDKPRIFAALQLYFDSHSPNFAVECRVKTGNKEWKKVLITGKMIFKDKREPSLRLAGLCQAISAQKAVDLPVDQDKPSKHMGLNGISELVIYQDLDFNILWCNQVARNNAGHVNFDIVGEKCHKVWFNRNEPCTNCLVEKALAKDGFTDDEIVTPEGVVYAKQAYPLKDENGKITGTVIILRNITEQKEIHQKLESSERKYRDLFERNPLGLFKFDARGNIIDANQYILNVLGAPDKDAFTHVSMLLPAGAPKSLIKSELLDTMKEGIPRDGEIRFVSRWGKEVWLYYKASPICDERGNVFETIVACEEISERKKIEEKIRFLSFTDPLTGFYNRAFFEEELKRLDTPRQLPLSLIMADLNGLKLINDAFGHHKGDMVLKKAAEALRLSCRKEDIIARLGGDEFVVLLPMTDADTANEVVGRIKKNCRKLEEANIQISLAVGMATRMSTGTSIEDIFKEAEDRMYRNKLIESRNLRSSFIISLERTLREKSHESEEHTRRLQKMVTVVGKKMELNEPEIDNLNLLAALHDIGKIAIPSSILDKAGKLTPEEWEYMKKHPEIGYRIALSTPELVPISEAILAHHEAWNGSGYPLGLRGNKIPLPARILAVCDTYDVMVSGRPYRGAVSQQEALEEIKRCAGMQFDPEIVGLFVEYMS